MMGDPSIYNIRAPWAYTTDLSQGYFFATSYMPPRDRMIDEDDSDISTDDTSHSSYPSATLEFSETTYNTMSENTDSDSNNSESPQTSDYGDLISSSLHDHQYIPTHITATLNGDGQSDIVPLINNDANSSSVTTRPSVIVGTPSNNTPVSPGLPDGDSQLSMPSTSNNKNNKTANYSPHADEPPAKCSKLDTSQSDYDGQTCPVCFEPWTTAGDHRMASLKCGHLFGYSCIVKWIHSMHNKACPTCKAKSTIRDIRFIYAKTLSCVDNSEIEAVKAELELVKEEKNRGTLELHKMALNEQVYIKKIKDLEAIIDSLKNNKDTSPENKQLIMGFYLKKNIEVSKKSGCRVFVHHKFSNSLFISQISSNPLFPGYGIRQLDCENYNLNQFVLLHSKEIRAIAYSEYNNLIMTVSLDKNIKLSSPNRDKQFISFSTDIPLWSCCWDNNQPHRMYAGGVGGLIMQYDMRQTRTCLSRISPSRDLSPVVSVAPVSGGIISCQLNSVKAHKKVESAFQSTSLPLEGPFQNLNYEPTTEQLIVSTRPNSQTPYCQYLVCNVNIFKDDKNCEILHTFRGASKQTLMSKTTQFNIGKDYLFAAHSEDDKAVHIWSINNQKRMMSLNNRDPIIDTCPWKIDNEHFLATLSQNSAKIYKVSYI